MAEPSTATTMCSKGLAVEVLDDEGVGLREPPDDALGDRAEHRVLDGGHAHGAYDDEVEVVVVDVLDDDLEVLALEGAADELDVVLLAEGLEDVYVGVGDDLESLGDELVVDLALPLHLVLVAELLGEPGLHLAEADVVHLGGVGVATRDPAPELPRNVDAYDARLVGVVRVVDRDVDLFVHVPFPSPSGRRTGCYVPFGVKSRLHARVMYLLHPLTANKTVHSPAVSGTASRGVVRVACMMPPLSGFASEEGG